MQIFLNTKYDFVGVRRIAYVVSAIAVSFGILGILFGLNYGIDFTGGNLVQVKFEKPIQVDQVRNALAKVGLQNAELQSVGEIGHELLIRVPQMENQSSGELIKNELRKSFSDYGLEIRREESVGPKIGSELRETAYWAVIISLTFMIIYIWFRFELRFGIAAVVALFHDVLVVVGLLWLTRQEITLTVIAAILTLVGFSINDTIVVFDRIRENMRLMRRSSLTELVNLSINQTLSRTVITSLTVFIVVFVILLFGGEVLFGFAFSMTFGVITGTYSTIFIAIPLVIEWENYQEKKVHERLQSKKKGGKKIVKEAPKEAKA